jgi:serine/threonine-protein kinase
MRQLLITVQKLHEFGIIHRDLKPNNIMLRISEKEIVPVVIDFGLATYKINLANEKDERKFSGTANFVAP